MLFKPDVSNRAKDTAKAAGEGMARIAARARRRNVSIFIVLLIAGGLAYVYWPFGAVQQRQGFARGNQPVPVLAATPRVEDVPVYFEGVGAARPLNTVTVRAQVDGRLLKINFRDGQDVTAGDVLAEIDPVLFQAQLDQAVAKKAQDEAQLANARLDLDRYRRLAASNAGSKQQADTQAATVAQLEALVQADQALIDTARTTLGYTKVIAPLTGRAGLRQVDQGNLIRASDANGLVVITQMKPISVQFSLPQQQIPRVNAAQSAAPLAVEVFADDGRSVIDTGTLQSIDNQVDQTTGTVRLRAELPNDRLQLWPGQFVNVRLRVETLPQAVVVPTSAVQRGPNGTFVYMIGGNNAVSARLVTVTQQNDTDAVIASGLEPTERVVTTGFANLAEGTRVDIGTADNLPTLDNAPRRQRPGGGPKQFQKGPPQGQGPAGGAQKGGDAKGGQGGGAQKGPGGP
jgi:membrane fusion protein, multidrug efflux system